LARITICANTPIAYRPSAIIHRPPAIRGAPQ
jgi:hypothetical protein